GLRVVRWSSCAPRRASSSCTLRLTVVLGRRSERAAPMKLPCSTTLTKIRVSLRSWVIAASGCVGWIGPPAGQLFPQLGTNQVLIRGAGCAASPPTDRCHARRPAPPALPRQPRHAAGRGPVGPERTP